MVRRLAAALLVLAAAPVRADTAADRASLKQGLDDLVARSVLGQARLGVQVMRLDDGTVLYSRNGEELFNPASNVKLFTTAAALWRLGPDYKFDTEFLVDRQAEQKRLGGGAVRFKSGDIKGPLYVRGKGDPSMTAEKLYGLANDLWFAGLRSVSGDLVLDDTYFDEEAVGPGFDQERSDRGYMAPAGALSLESNAVAIHIAPADSVGAKALVEAEPDSSFFVVENRTLTGPETGLRRLFVTSLPNGEKQKLVVSGRIPLGSQPTTVWRKIDQPTFYFGQTLKAMLEKRGIKIRGRVRRAAAPRDAVPYLLHQSETLDLVLKKTNKNSSNFMAEQLLKTMGAQASGTPGSWRAGVSAVEEFLSQQVGIPAGTFVMKNGSGLNDTNRFSTAQICRLLRFMWQHFPLAPEYLSSLAIAGKDGTVHTRMEGTDAAGRLRAKTGTLENVSALSGYVESRSGERLVFSLLVNDFPGRLGPVMNGLDAVGIELAGYGSESFGSTQAFAQAFGPARVAGSLDELKARIGTWDGLAKARDPRNLAFLRTALRSERDPALRAVIAEAILRTEPDDSGAARLLLENFDSGPEVFGRLRQAAGADRPTPVLGALLRLAGEGNADALSRLVEVTAAARGDEGLRSELLEPLGEVARNAPDELVAALHGAREPVAQAALDVLAKSLAKATDDHPFPAALKRIEIAADPQLALYVHELSEDLQTRISAERATKADAPAPTTDVVPAKEVKPAAASKPSG